MDFLMIKMDFLKINSLSSLHPSPSDLFPHRTPPERACQTAARAAYRARQGAHGFVLASERSRLGRGKKKVGVVFCEPQVDEQNRRFLVVVQAY